MAKSKITTREKTDSELIVFAQKHVTAMSGNANYPTPLPNTTEFATGLTAMQNSVQALAAAQQAVLQAVSVRDTARASLESLLSRRAAFVDVQSGGDEAKILSSGFEVRATGGSIGELPAPLDFLATMGDDPGEIDLTWSPVYGAKSYVVECSEHSIPPQWRQVKIVTKSKVTVPGLTSGKEYAFRVAAVGTAGQGPWSDESVKMSP